MKKVWQERQRKLDEWYIENGPDVNWNNCELVENTEFKALNSCYAVYLAKYIWKNGEKAELLIRPKEQGSAYYEVMVVRQENPKKFSEKLNYWKSKGVGSNPRATTSRESLEP